MVEQNVRFGLELADHATVMSAGRVVLTGTAAEIRDTPDLMDVFFGAARRPAASRTTSGEASGELTPGRERYR